jgi:N-acetylmuramoyl-L-alanine amidase/putative methionine-R-sulfoxide reductase with GAF domain
MVMTPTKPGLEDAAATPRVQSPRLDSVVFKFVGEPSESRPAGGDALQALLAFSAMHQQVRHRRALAVRRAGFENTPTTEFESSEQFVLDEVLQLVAERAIAITGADGIGIALAENNEIVLRASAGVIKPGLGERIERDSAFSGACFRQARIIRCDDTETDDRVNVESCRQLGARSMVAVPLCGRRRVIGVLEAFSAEPFGFNDSDVASLELLAELILAALKPEDEDRFADSAKIAEAKLAAAPPAAPSAKNQRSETQPIAPAIHDAKINDPKIADPKISDTKISAPKISDGKTDSPAIIARNLEHAIEESASALLTAAESPTKEKPGEPTNASVAPPATPVLIAAEAAPTAGSTQVIWILAAIAAAALITIGIWWKLHSMQPPQPANENQQAESSSAPSSPAQSGSASTTTALTAPTADHKTSAANSGENSSSAIDESATSEQPAEQSSEQPTEPSSEPSAKMTRITGIRHWSSQDSSTVVLDLADQAQYEAHRLAHPDRVYFDLHDTSLAPGLAGKTIDIGDALLARVRLAQPSAGLTRLVLETKGNSNYSVSLEPNPYRLLVRVQKVGADPNAQVNLFPGASQPKLAIVVPPPTRQDLQLRAHVPKLRIVVDAGHGGWDLGTVGRQGLLEKDLVLEIALRLGKLLESRLGADVILTRSDDNYIPLDERAELANQAQADLFVSVHANYSDLPSARGVETYYTNFFTSPSAKDLETRSGSTNLKTTSPAALTPLELHAKVEQSRHLAASVQRSLYGTLAAQNPGLRDRGVKEASYVVLTETAMPGILAEVSFVSSPTDEQKLRSDGYREQIAEALYKGIGRYAATLHPVKLASAK